MINRIPGNAIAQLRIGSTAGQPRRTHGTTAKPNAIPEPIATPQGCNIALGKNLDNTISIATHNGITAPYSQFT